MLAADVALIFDVETREIVQNIKSNPDLFPERYAFELEDAEIERLRSAGLISKPGRGGSRALPWVVTRLTTIMRNPRAIQAADIFDTIVEQLQSGSRQVSIVDRERKGLDNFRMRLSTLQEIVELRQKLEPNALVQLANGFSPATPLIANDVTGPRLTDRRKSPKGDQ